MSAAESSESAGDSSESTTDPSEPTDDPSILVVDNYDSFTYNLVEYLSAHAEVTVVTNTASLETIRDADPDGIVCSPGPGHPENDRDVGVSRAVLTELSPSIPTLGVCLGLEAAVYEYGGSVGRAPEPVHGKASPVHHDGEGVFAGLEQAFPAGRYHSLVATTVPSCFAVTATTDHDGESLVMGVRHRSYPLECVQFHPESVLTGVGHALVENFVRSV
ncbi:glutamine amidotransferase of anthranilate synthase or aminodeoxychorismate synthase [Halovivax ruber XH-70]|uniref:anthranilate synthase n=1 Tax=Halovivax ruber (strain DSM 18193 / JCM 13892 / XH-70) TaxID=797302 RepID=L0IFG1_HALRX|nr:anthranilate synthase component II [Halovivax ruber]AGB16707.1 glutamine amidotransferase of anthranilate synthase or aminodeoxychorismate synthase [Halovivax ruber XH-70]